MTAESSRDDTQVGVEGIDPVTFQIIKHRLARITDEAVEALKRVSGAPNTNEGHDLIVALYTADGGLLTGGVGFLHHYIGASEATKRIIERFEDEINEGDVFVMNDSYTAALHPPDVYIIKPIFFDGSLKAFSASFVHVADIGAVDPGGFAPNSTSIFHEGFQTPGLKLIDEGVMRDDVLDTILNMSRDPGMVELDLRSEIAANNVAEERMKELFEEYGAETVEHVGNELIRQSETRFRDRLRELPDAQFQERQYLDSAPEDKRYTIDLTLKKEGDSLTFDFTGTSDQSKYGFNATYWASRGGVFAPIFPLLCHDMTWNDGLVNVVDVEAPDGSIVSADRPAPISIATVATIQICNNLSTITLSKLLGASEKYRNRATAVWSGAHAHVMLQIHKNGETFVDSLTDSFAGAGGARAFDDGVDLGGEVPNIVARWGNVERHERSAPLMYLYRRFVEDSGGPGKFRGGVGHDYAVTPISDDDVEGLDIVTFGRGTRISQSLGLFGGYPGPTVKYSISRDTDLWDSAASFPPDEDTSGQDTENAVWGVHEVEPDDIFYVRFSGTGGYGDPLERNADDVANDVAEGKISPKTARSVYGVPLTEDGERKGSVQDTREDIQKGRITDDQFEEPVQLDQVESTEFRMGEYLDIVTDGDTRYLSCESCETVLTPLNDDWKTNLVVNEIPPSQGGKYRESDPEICLRQFCCPNCGRLVETELAAQEHPYLKSIVY